MSAPVDTAKRPGGKRPGGWRERARISTEKATSPPDMEGLSSTLKRGATYSAIALLFGQLVSFGQTIVLARLLSPSDVGLFVAGSILSGFLISISEGGLRGALIQRENDVARAADTVFWATSGTGMLLAVVALGSAPIVGFVSGFDGDSAATVAGIAAASAGLMLIHALTNVPDGLMQRQFNFRRRLIVDPARMLVFAVVSIAFAAAGFGAWAQVIGNYAAMLTWLALSWWFSGWVPGFARPSYRMWREMAKFAFPLMMEGLVEKVRSAIESTLIGRGLGEGSLGNYRYGQRLSLIPGNAVVQIGSYVLFPAFARLASDPDRLRNAFLRGLQWAWLASVAVAGLVIAIGQPAVVVLFGDEWRAAGLAFVALAGFGPGIALSAAGSEAIKATGRSQLLNWTTLTSIVLGLGLLVVLIPVFGLFGVGLAASITELAVGVVILVLTYRVIPFSVPAVLRTIVPPLVIGAGATAVVGYIEHTFVHADQHGLLISLLALVAESLLFMVIFLAGMAVVEPQLARRAVKAIKSKLRRGGDDEDDDEDDGIERRDPILDPPTMLMPAFRADETMEFGRRMSRDWGSPTAQTMILPVVRPRPPARPSEETTRVAVRPSEETTRVPARIAEADAAVDRAEDAIESGERIPVASSMAAVDGPTEMALPARRAGTEDPPRPGAGAHAVRPTPGPRDPDLRRPAPGSRSGAPDGFGRGGPSSLPPGAVPPFDGPPPVPPGRAYDSGSHSLPPDAVPPYGGPTSVPPGAVPPYDSGAHSLPPGAVPPYDGRAGGGVRRPPGPGPQGAGQPGPGRSGPPQPGPPQPGPPQPGPRQPGPRQPGPGQAGPVPPGPVQPGSGRPGAGEPGPRPQGPPRPHPGQPNPGQQGPLLPASGPGPYGRPGPYRPSPRPPADAEGGPRPAPQGPPGAGVNGGPGRPYNGARNGAPPNGGPRNGVPNGAWPLNGDSGRHSARQAPPNGGRGPRPPTPPWGTAGPLAPPPPAVQPPPQGPSPSPSPRPSPRRHRYLDDSGPQPVQDEPVAPEPAPRRHRYLDDDEDVRPADPTRESRVADDDRQERRPEDRPRPRPRPRP